MALLFLEDDPWLTEYESCEKLYRDIMEQLAFRQKYSRVSNQYSALSARIRLHLKQFDNEVEQLNQKLQDITESGNITSAESERRVRQIEMLYSKATQMKKIFEEYVTGSVTDKDRTVTFDDLGSTNTSGNVSGAATSVTDLRQNQKMLLQEQQHGLETLSQIISRQKNIAHTISNEVDFHNEILEDLGNQMDHTNETVRRETQHISVVGNKDRTCAYWVVTILLFISIVVVAAV